MAVIICQASLGSNGGISGDAAGNQNGRELNSSGYYADDANKWHIMRSSDPVIAERTAAAAEVGVANKHIGYDQSQRNTLLAAAERVGWILSKVDEDSETDCVAFAAVCLICATDGVVRDILFAGRNLPYSGNAVDKFTRAGLREVGLAGKNDWANLRRGDILVRNGHTVVVTGAPGQEGISEGAPAIRYRVRTEEDGWLPWMEGLRSTDGSDEDFAGEPGHAIVDFEWDAPNGSWFYLTHDGKPLCRNEHNESAYPLTGITLYYATPQPEASGYFRAKYRVAPIGATYLKWEFDDKDDGAGGAGVIDRLQLTLVR